MRARLRARSVHYSEDAGSLNRSVLDPEPRKPEKNCSRLETRLTFKDERPAAGSGALQKLLGEYCEGGGSRSCKNT